VAIGIDAASVPLTDAARVACAADAALFSVALTGGDDYEIAASVPPARLDGFLAALAAAGVPATVIGAVSSGEGLTAVGSDGRPLDLGTGSFAHF
jgi:thiamine-monophosphate kinase